MKRLFLYLLIIFNPSNYSHSADGIYHNEKDFFNALFPPSNKKSKPLTEEDKKALEAKSAEISILMKKFIDDQFAEPAKQPTAIYEDYKITQEEELTMQGNAPHTPETSATNSQSSPK